ncbi:transcriptional regulator, LysR family [Variovorax paradoxus B4]|uniref:Transcriptional regulator, LysR family n=1 Tax=Variovorax paradoxus B4 TaxID=1246301 RepID=T1XA69_VARPD|nr:LysR family transcriptional regulator [Variovorax paradoxus]AGU49381.1 transcriptional regulator, LysR family [Variovorax paradoxus B4]
MHKVNEHGGGQRPLPRNLDVTLLELFDCIGRTRNLSAAGAQLGMSQPTVSRALGRLRTMYGDQLFIRQPRGVAPTPLAEALAAPMAAALEALRATFSRPGFDPTQEDRVFRVAMSDIGERLFLPRLMQHVAREAPHVSIDAITSQVQLQDGLGSGHIDLAVGFFGPLSKQLHQRRLFRERFVYVARSNHPSLDGHLPREQLREIGHVVGGPEGMEHAAAVQKVLAGPRVRARVALRVHSFLCIAPVVAATDLIGVIPSNLATVVAGHIPLQVLDPPVQFPGFDVTMTWHQRHHGDAASIWLRNTFFELFKSGVNARD